MRARLLARWQLAAAMACAVLAVSCGDDDTGPGTGTVKDYFAAVQAAVNVDASVHSINPKSAQVASANRVQLSLRPPTTVTGSFHSGDAPSESGGPVMQATPGSTPLVGQPFRLDVSAAGPFNKVYVSVDGVSGYWELDLPSSVSFITLVLTLADDPPSSTFTTNTAVAGSGGTSAPASTPITTEDLANADLAITLKWTGASDVDLHVIDPHEEEIYFANRESSDGGKLDLDSNAACDIDNINQETISWPANKAPEGSYLVRVEYFDDCGQDSAPFTVTVRKKGGSPQTFNGTFTGSSSDTQSKDVTTVEYP
jgi:hypothetical protein